MGGFGQSQSAAGAPSPFSVGVRHLAACTLVAAVLLAPASALGDPGAKGDASAFVEHLGRRIISLLADSQKETKRKIDSFRKIFENACDMALIGRQVLGRHWRTASATQRRKYQRLFSEYVVQIYAARFKNYSGESFDVMKEQGSASSDRVVKARIIRDNGEITHVDFRVRKDAVRFRVVDVAIRGVSLLVAKRSEFDAIVRRQGMNGLLQQLEARLSETS